MPPHRDKDDPPEWTYLTFDTDEDCAICKKPIHVGQAVGRIKGKFIHAKCYENPRERA